jgi:hypothetical protein
MLLHSAQLMRLGDIWVGNIEEVSESMLDWEGR